MTSATSSIGGENTTTIDSEMSTQRYNYKNQMNHFHLIYWLLSTVHCSIWPIWRVVKYWENVHIVLSEPKKSTTNKLSTILTIIKNVNELTQDEPVHLPFFLHFCIKSIVPFKRNECSDKTQFMECHYLVTRLKIDLAQHMDSSNV